MITRNLTIVFPIISTITITITVAITIIITVSGLCDSELLPWA